MGTCYQCGSPVSDAADLCPYCGMAVVPGTVPAAAGTVPAGTPHPPAAPYPATAPLPPVATLAGPRLDTPAAGAAIPRPSRRAVLIAGVVVLALIGGGIAYLVLKPAPPSGTASVQRYFDALAADDPGAALKLVADAGRYGGQGFPLLDAKALAAKENRPTGLRIVHSAPVTDFARGKVDSVQVSYRLGSATVDQTILAGQPSTGGPYLLQNPFLHLGMDASGGRPVSVNGIDVGTGGLDTYAFPAVYTATAAGTALLTGDTRTAAVQSGPDGQPVTAISFGTPALASGAQDAIQAQVKQAIDTCAQSTSATPDNCPFSTYVGGDNVSVHWKVVSYPNVTITVAPFPSGDAQVSIDANDGMVHYDATYTDYTGATQTDSGDQDFGIHGTASANGTAITVSLH